jgi:hypothetical protein
VSIPTSAPEALSKTHVVFNQAPDLDGYNPYLADLALREAVVREGAAWAEQRLVGMGVMQAVQRSSSGGRCGPEPAPTEKSRPLRKSRRSGGVPPDTSGADPRLDVAVETLKSLLQSQRIQPVDGRRLVELMARTLQASLLVRSAPKQK